MAGVAPHSNIWDCVMNDFQRRAPPTPALPASARGKEENSVLWRTVKWILFGFGLCFVACLVALLAIVYHFSALDQEFKAKGINSKILEKIYGPNKNQAINHDSYEITNAFPASESLSTFRQQMQDGGFNCFTSNSSPPKVVSCRTQVRITHVACGKFLIIKASFDQAWNLQKAEARFTCSGL